MSELYKAMKRIEDYQSTKPLYKQIAGIKGIASTARYGYDIQPQLTIPKRIADELENLFYGLDATDLEYVLDETEPDGVIALNDYYLKNKNIIALYLASRALGVDLVKVVER